MDDIELIDSLLKRAEGPDLDFKSTPLKIDELYLKVHFIKDLVSMANTPRDGNAYIVYGIMITKDANKEIKGVKEHPDDANLQELVTSKVSPAPKFHYRPVTYKGTTLGIIEIPPHRGGLFIPQFDYEHVINKGTPYCRHGSSNAIASASDLREIIEDGRNTQQIKYNGLSFIDIGGGAFDYPCYFPSVSSLRTQYTPLQYLKILHKSNYPWFLVSAYDIEHAEGDKPSIIGLMKEAVSMKKALLDSGYYESSSKGDKTWNQRTYWDVLKSCEFSYAFSFDQRKNNEGKSHDYIANEVLKSWKKDVEESKKDNIIPIVHADKPEDFLGIIPKVVQAINPVMIAVPERELGEGIIATARTLFDIRKVLHEMKSSCPIHLLGTGNPISILIYSICGANSYDGLEWCQMISNFNSAQLHHMKHYDFLENQSGWVSDFGVKWGIAALMHNIEFYSFWMTQIHAAIKRNEIIDFLKGYLPLGWDKTGKIINPIDLLVKAIPELFQIQGVK